MRKRKFSTAIIRRGALALLFLAIALSPLPSDAFQRESFPTNFYRGGPLVGNATRMEDGVESELEHGRGFFSSGSANTGRSDEQPLFASTPTAVRPQIPGTPASSHEKILPQTSIAAGTAEYVRSEPTARNPMMGSEVVSSAGAVEYEYVLQWGSGGSGDGELSELYGIAVDVSGNVYVPDLGNHRVQKFDSSGSFLTKWGSFGSGDGEFFSPTGIAVDVSGNVYVAEYGNHRVQKFDSSGRFLTKWGSEGHGDGEFSYPYGIAVDASGDVYVADTSNYRIQKFDSSGSVLTKWGSFGSGDGEFIIPIGIAVDASGNVYVTDCDNRVQKFDSSGRFLTKWGSQGSDDVVFSNPQGIAVDSSGDVYITDSNNRRVQKLDSSGRFLTKWGSQGSDDGQFQWPQGIAVDASGDVYVVDTSNSRIQKFRPVGGPSPPPTPGGLKADVFGGLIQSIAPSSGASAVGASSSKPGLFYGIETLLTELFMKDANKLSAKIDFKRKGFTADGESRLFIRVQSSTPGKVLVANMDYLKGLGIQLETLETPEGYRRDWNESGEEMIEFREGKLKIYQVTLVLRAPEAWPGEFDEKHPKFKVEFRRQDSLKVLESVNVEVRREKSYANQKGASPFRGISRSPWNRRLACRGDPKRQASRKRLLNESGEDAGRSASEPVVASKTQLSSAIPPQQGEA